MQPARRIVQREPARGAARQLKAWDCSMGRGASRLILIQRNRLGADFEESRLGKGVLAILKRATVCRWLSVSRHDAGSSQKRRLANLSPHCLFRGCRMCGDRQLQHSRTLTLAQARDQHHQPVRELPSSVMGHGVVHVDLPEACEPLPDLLVWQNAGAKRRLTFDILVECNFGAGQQADRNMRLAGRRKTACDGITKLGRHQLVLDPGRPGRDMVQTIVTHRRDSSSCGKLQLSIDTTSHNRAPCDGPRPETPAASEYDHPGIPPDDSSTGSEY